MESNLKQYYVLFNTETGKHLSIPSVGLWFTEKQTEAEGMKRDCQSYLVSVGLKEMVDKIEIRMMDENGKEAAY